MASRLQRILASLDLEERILTGAALAAAGSVFFPWMSGEWLGGDFVSYSGFQSFTSVIGFAVFLLNLGILVITFLPFFARPHLLKRRMKEIIRLAMASQAMVLTLAAISVLTLVTYDYTRMEIRFGIWFTLTGSLVAMAYAFIKLQQVRRSDSIEHFGHPEERHTSYEAADAPMSPLPPPPPPPPPMQPEEHRVHP